MSAVEILHDDAYQQPKAICTLSVVPAHAETAEILQLPTNLTLAHIALETSVEIIDVQPLPIYTPRNPFKWSSLSPEKQSIQINKALGSLHRGTFY